MIFLQSVPLQCFRFVGQFCLSNISDTRCVHYECGVPTQELSFVSNYLFNGDYWKMFISIVFLLLIKLIIPYPQVIGFFPTMDMQAPSPPLSFGPVFMDDVKCGEKNEKSIFRFLFFEL